MSDQPAFQSPAIVLTGACVSVQGRTILRGITLTLTEPRIGIIGRNGSGKTTLLRLIAGLVAPSAGQVRVGALNPAKDRKGLLAQVGILFQNPDHQILFPTVIEELTFGLTQQGLTAAQADARAMAQLTAEGRAAWRDVPCHHLSQGQRQYLCLMAVLLMQPQTILLDEPLAGLDLPTQTRLNRRFAALPQRLITISHDPAAMKACSRVIWLEGGAVRQDGAAEAVLDAFQTEMARLGGADADTDLAP